MSQGSAFVPAGYTLTLTTPVSSTGTYYNNRVLTSVAANTTVLIGPFVTDQKYLFQTVTGSMTAVLTQALTSITHPTGLQTISGTSQLAAINTAYMPTSGSLTSVTLPAIAPFGCIIAVIGSGSGGYKVLPAVGQNIQYNSNDATTKVQSSDANDVIYLMCTVANTTWTTTQFVSLAGFTYS